MIGSVCPIGDAFAVGFAGSDGYSNRASNNLIRELSNAPFSATEYWAAERPSEIELPSGVAAPGADIANMMFPSLRTSDSIGRGTRMRQTKTTERSRAQCRRALDDAEA
jgi:hypothetical protein